MMFRDRPRKTRPRIMEYFRPLIGIEFVTDTQQPDPQLMEKVMKGCLEKSVIVLSCGIHSNVIRIIPPLIIDEATLLKGLKIVTDVIKQNSH